MIVVSDLTFYQVNYNSYTCDRKFISIINHTTTFIKRGYSGLGHKHYSQWRFDKTQPKFSKLDASQGEIAQQGFG